MSSTMIHFQLRQAWRTQSRRALLMLTLGLSTLGAPSVRAEYRVYELAITDAASGQSRVVVSTLDDRQYPTYHPLNSGETVALVSSWRCWGRSEGFKALCPNPQLVEATQPANAPAPSANSAPAAP